MSATLVRVHAAADAANPQIVPLTGKTAGRELYALFVVSAIPTVAAPWVSIFDHTIAGGDAVCSLWRLPAAANTSGVTQLSIPLNAGRPVSAVIFEDTATYTEGSL